MCLPWPYRGGELPGAPGIGERKKKKKLTGAQRRKRRKEWAVEHASELDKVRSLAS